MGSKQKLCLNIIGMPVFYAYAEEGCKCSCVQKYRQAFMLS